MRKKIFSCGVYGTFCLSLLILMFSGCTKESQQSKEISLEEELSIGTESGDEHEMFASIGDVALDAGENIHILDWKDGRLRKYDREGNFLQGLEVKRGGGPEEVSYVTGMAVTEKGRVYALDRNSGKVLAFNEKFEFIRSFTAGFQAIDILPCSEDKLIILGLKNDKIFHVFDQEGKLLESFGEPFDIPSEYNQYRNLPLIKLPRRADRTKGGKIFLVNPHKYEIRVYEGNEFHHLIELESEFFRPFSVVRTIQDESTRSYQIAMRFPYVSVFEHKNRLYVSIRSWETDSPHQMEVFENEKRIASLKTTAFASAIDKKGRLYLIEEEDFPRLIRASVLHTP